MTPEAIKRLSNPNGLTIQEQPVINNYIILSPPVNPSHYQDRVSLGNVSPINPQIAQLQNALYTMSNMVQQMAGIMPYNGSNLSQTDQLNDLLAQTYNETGQLYGQSGLGSGAIDPQLRQLLNMAYGAISDTNQYMNNLNGNGSQSANQYGAPQNQQQYSQGSPGPRYTLPNGTEVGQGSSPGFRYQYPNGYEIPIDPNSPLAEELMNNPINNTIRTDKNNEVIAKKAAKDLREALRKDPNEVKNILSNLNPQQIALAERYYGEASGSHKITQLREDINSSLKGISKVDVLQMLNLGAQVNPIANAIALKHAVEQKPSADARALKELLSNSDPQFRSETMKYYDAISPEKSFKDAVNDANFKDPNDKSEILDIVKDSDSTSSDYTHNKIDDLERTINKDLDNTDQKDLQIAELTADNIHKLRFSGYEQTKVTEQLSKLTPEQLALTEIAYGKKYGNGDYSALRKDLEYIGNSEAVKKLEEIASSNSSSAAIAIKASLDKQTNWFNRVDSERIKNILNNLNEEEIARMVQEYNVISPDKTLTAYIKEQRFESDSDKEKILQTIQQALYRHGGTKTQL